MGLSSSSDKWCCHSDDIVEGLPSTKKIVNDILIWAPNLQTLKSRFNTVMDRYWKINITISQSKFKIGDKLQFLVLLWHTTVYIQTPNKQISQRNSQDQRLNQMFVLSQAQPTNWHLSFSTLLTPLRATDNSQEMGYNSSGYRNTRKSSRSSRTFLQARW